MRLRWPSAFLAAVVISSTVSMQSAGAVADGVKAGDGQFPFAVKLTMTGVVLNGSTYNSACSGALVAATWVITAGHCFHDASGKRVSGAVPYATTATFGAAQTTAAGAQTISIDTVRQSATADVALAHLTAVASAGAPIAISTSAPRRGQILTLAGWGALSDVNPQPQSQLYYGEVKTQSIKSSTILVAGYWPSPQTSACLYDSGAPYFGTGSTPLLYSVESNGPSCPHSTPETTARTDNIAGWIHSIIG